MKFKLFRYPIDGDGDMEEMNGFLSSHAIVGVSRNWVQGPNGAVLAFVVEYADEQAPGSQSSNRGADALKDLTDGEAALFNSLRDLRKQIAEAEKIPVWTIFSNQALRSVVKRLPDSVAALSAVPHVGEGRAKKYGERVLEVLRDARPMLGAEPQAAGGEQAPEA